MPEVHEVIHEVNALDYGIMGLIAVSVLLGTLRGFVREAMSLVTWVTALVVGVIACETVASWLTMISMVGLRIVLAFVLIVLTILIAGGLMSHLIGKLIKFTGFGATDRIIGTMFGLVRGAVVVAAVVLLANPTPFSKDPLWTSSMLVPRFEPISLWMKERLPEDLMKKVQL